MPGPIHSPLDVGMLPEAVQPSGGDWSDRLMTQAAPPIIPRVTALGPEKTRHILQAMMGGESLDQAYDEENDEGEDMDWDNATPEELMSCASQMGAAAVKIAPELPGVLCAIIKSVQQGMMMSGGGGGGVGLAPAMGPGVSAPPMMQMGTPPAVPAPMPEMQ